MYLSRIGLDMQRYETLRALQNPEVIHSLLESSFSVPQQRILWRNDVLNNMEYLLVLSQDPPQNEALPYRLGFDGSRWETKDYAPLMDKIQTGSIWRFRLTANPTMSSPAENGQRGKVKAITITAKQKEWLLERAESHGFLLHPDQYDVMKSEWKNFDKQGCHVSMLSTVFEGILTISNPDIFRKTLVEGIGRGKAYGNGLLTVVRYE